MEKTIIEVLKIQRNEAMDTIAVLNGHLASSREEIESLRKQNSALSEKLTNLEVSQAEL
jgi:uncharacterized coiled-coil protein SlyX